MSLVYHILRESIHYPKKLRQRLDSNSPEKLSAVGDARILTLNKTALFCSTKCPGDAILRAYDQAARWRNEGRCIISGFHSPIEKECLRILIRGKQSLIICPARGLEKMRMASEWRRALDEGRLLILSCFGDGVGRATVESAQRRHELVAAIADEVWFAHISPGGQMEKTAFLVQLWGKTTNIQKARISAGLT